MRSSNRTKHNWPSIKDYFKLSSDDIFCTLNVFHRVQNNKRCEWDLSVHFFFTLSLSPTDPVFPRSATVQTGPMNQPSGVFWSARGCSEITCLMLWWEHSRASPAKTPSPSARRQLAAASTTLCKDGRLTDVLPEQNVVNHMRSWRFTSCDLHDWVGLVNTLEQAVVIHCCFALFIYIIHVCFQAWVTLWATVCHELWMCVVYNIWQCCSFPVMSVFNILCLCVCVDWLMQAAHWSQKASDLVFLSSGEDLKGSVIQDMRTKGYILPQNAGLSILTIFF